MTIDLIKILCTVVNLSRVDFRPTPGSVASLLSDYLSCMKIDNRIDFSYSLSFLSLPYTYTDTILCGFDL